MLRRVFVAATVTLSFALPALAQTMPVRIYGPITKIEGRTVTTMNRDGQTVSFDLAPQGRIVTNEPIDVRTIKAGDVIAFDEVMGKVIQAHTQAFGHGANAPPHRRLRPIRRRPAISASSRRQHRPETASTSLSNWKRTAAKCKPN